MKFLTHPHLFIIGASVIFAGLFALSGFSLKKNVNEKLDFCDCNVIVISVDSLRADRVGIYGSLKNITPEIDSWFAGGIIFKNYIAQSYLTPISENAVHTSLYPLSSGVINFDSILDKKFNTLAEILKLHGYYTAA